MERTPQTDQRPVSATADAVAPPTPVFRPAPDGTVLVTERVRLRLFTPADADALQGVLGDARVMYAWGHAFDRAMVEEWLAATMERAERFGCAHFAAESRADGAFLGAIGLLRRPVLGRSALEAVWILGHDHWHRGYATEAGRALCAHAFERVGEPWVCSLIRRGNAPSAAVAERLGMTVRGSVDVPYRGEILVHDIHVVDRETFQARGEG